MIWRLDGLYYVFPLIGSEWAAVFFGTGEAVCC